MVGELPHFSFVPRPHWDLGPIVEGLDFERGIKMSGSRFFVMRGALARLHRALTQFFLNEHVRAGFTECYLPDMLTEASLYAAGQLPKFRENLYRDAEATISSARMQKCRSEPLSGRDHRVRPVTDALGAHTRAFGERR